MGELSDFGKLTRYDWWPPIHERELAHCTGEVFIHPVLAGRRYVKSLFKSNFRSGVIVSAKLILAALRRSSRQPGAASSLPLLRFLKQPGN